MKPTIKTILRLTAASALVMAFAAGGAFAQPTEYAAHPPGMGPEMMTPGSTGNSAAQSGSAAASGATAQKGAQGPAAPGWGRGYGPGSWMMGDGYGREEGEDNGMGPEMMGRWGGGYGPGPWMMEGGYGPGPWAMHGGYGPGAWGMRGGYGPGPWAMGGWMSPQMMAYGGEYGPGPWMMHGYGPGPWAMGGGWMGPPMMGRFGPGPWISGSGAMAPWMMGPWMMRWGGYGNETGWGPGQRAELNLNVDQVKAGVQRWLALIGNPHIKLGDVKQKSPDTITANIVTTDNGGLVQSFEINRQTGFVRPAGE